MLQTIALSSVIGITFLYGLDWALGLFDDAREPPCMRPSVPLIGHLIGMSRYGNEYLGQMSNKSTSEIFMLRIFNLKIYVSKSRHLIPIIQKNHKTLSFRPFIQTAMKALGDGSPQTIEIFGTGMVDDFSLAMKNGLVPGPHLDEQNLRMGRRVIQDVDQLLNEKEVNLLSWVRHAIVQASACGVYGAQHPMRDPKVEAAYWTWHQHMPSHFTGMDLTGTGYKARQVVFDVYVEYYKHIPDDASRLVHERQRVLRESGISKQDSDRIEATFTTAIFGNTAPTMFWALWEPFSRPEIVAELRQELERNAVTGSKQEGFKIDVASLKRKCPLLLSVLQETQRIRQVHANIRKVTSDTVLDGRYLLKAGNYLQMPGNPIHMDTTLWGQEAQVFDPHRFVPAAGSEKVSVAANSFTAWGAAPHLCPARQFASTEILILMALMIMRVDLKPANDSWELESSRGELASLQSPLEDVKVQILPRDDWAGTWSVEMGESKTRVPIASG
ncbi:cytochrome P450 [Stachybotrys elegans]|uniref:Cytochrome P450 n=1 Tax=Stachybotrys elegans TaxID=80388 RepID=A0A8K0SM60_9HYPO|nr:cytochrome P450 [Stachybotrys elegans]